MSTLPTPAWTAAVMRSSTLPVRLLYFFQAGSSGSGSCVGADAGSGSAGGAAGPAAASSPATSGAAIGVSSSAAVSGSKDGGCSSTSTATNDGSGATSSSSDATSGKAAPSAANAATVASLMTFSAKTFMGDDAVLSDDNKACSAMGCNAIPVSTIIIACDGLGDRSRALSSGDAGKKMGDSARSGDTSPSTLVDGGAMASKPLLLPRGRAAALDRRGVVRSLDGLCPRLLICDAVTTTGLLRCDDCDDDEAFRAWPPSPRCDCADDGFRAPGLFRCDD